jgi:hypothetical protein
MPLSAIAADAPAIHASESAARTYRRAGTGGRRFGAGMIDFSERIPKGASGKGGCQDALQSLKHDLEKRESVSDKVMLVQQDEQRLIQRR